MWIRQLLNQNLPNCVVVNGKGERGYETWIKTWMNFFRRGLGFPRPRKMIVEIVLRTQKSELNHESNRSITPKLRNLDSSYFVWTPPKVIVETIVHAFTVLNESP